MATVLVVEDNPKNMKLSIIILESMGHDVLQASDAMTGINMAKSYMPAIILMDLQLPDIDGLKATGILKNDPATAHIKILAMTAFAMKGDQERILASGCDGYLSKPIQLQEFRRLLETFLPRADGNSL